MTRLYNSLYREGGESTTGDRPRTRPRRSRGHEIPRANMLARVRWALGTPPRPQIVRRHPHALASRPNRIRSGPPHRGQRALETNFSIHASRVSGRSARAASSRMARSSGVVAKSRRPSRRGAFTARLRPGMGRRITAGAAANPKAIPAAWACHAMPDGPMNPSSTSRTRKITTSCATGIAGTPGIGRNRVTRSRGYSRPYAPKTAEIPADAPTRRIGWPRLTARNANAPNAPPARYRIAHRGLPTRSSNVGEMNTRPRRFRNTCVSEACTNWNVTQDHGAGAWPTGARRPKSNTIGERTAMPNNPDATSSAYTTRIATAYARDKSALRANAYAVAKTMIPRATTDERSTAPRDATRP